MEAFGLYLLKSAIWLTGFTIVFLVFLRNERYFQLNRAYLLSGIFASIVFPFYTWHYAVILPSLPTPDISIPDISERVMVATAPTAEPGMPVYWWLYLVGIAFLAFRLIWQTIMVIRKLLKTGYVKNGPVKLVRTPEFSASFSFFSFVFVNPSTSDIEMKEIVNHECGHIQKRHWFDLLLVELLRMLQWFNPFAWIYAHLVRQNHEYMADKLALQHTSNPAIYQATLLNQMLGVPVISLANSFSYSLNKQRFKMMKKKIDSPIRKLRMLMVLPLIAMVFYAFAKPEYIEPQTLQTENVSAVAKEGIVKGKVITEDGKLLQGAVVVIRGTTIGTITDAQGNFTLKNVSEDAELAFSYVGLNSVRIKPDFKQSMTVKMIISTEGIEKVTVNAETSSAKEPESLSLNLMGDKENPPMYIFDGRIIDKSEFETHKIESDDIFSISVLKDKSATEKFGEKAKNGVIIITSKKNALAYGVNNVHDLNDLSVVGNSEQQKSKAKTEKDMKSAFQVVEQMPQYPGGAQRMMHFLSVNTKYPAQAKADKIEGTVVVNFVVSSTGKIVNVKVAKGVHPELDVEALRVVSSMPDWNPGEQNGKPVDVNYAMPVEFTLNGSSGKTAVIKANDDLNSRKQKPEIRDVFANKNSYEHKELVVLDGNITPWSEVSKINTNDIESISVLRGESGMVSYGEKGKNGVILISTYKKTTASAAGSNNIQVVGYEKMKNSDTDPQKEVVYSAVDVKPQYPGGEMEMMKFIKWNMKYPVVAQEEGATGTALVYFVINSSGKIVNSRVLNEVHPSLKSEALRVINKMSDFIPGKKDGKAVEVACTMPFKFTLTSSDNKSQTDQPTLHGDFGEVVVVGFGQKIPPPPPPVSADGERPYTVVEQMPQFPGGEKEMMKFIKNNLKYPVNAMEKGISGTVITSFVVNNDGKIGRIKVMRGVGSGCDEEAVRVLKLMPDWLPGKQGGKAVAVSYMVPFKFTLAGNNVKSEEKPFSGDVTPYSKVDEKPQFPGGEMEMMKFIKWNMKYPVIAQEEGATGNALVYFTINSSGQIVNARVLTEVHPSLKSEALRIINKLPAFTPGKKAGKAVDVACTIPFKFILQFGEKKSQSNLPTLQGDFSEVVVVGNGITKPSASAFQNMNQQSNDKQPTQVVEQPQYPGGKNAMLKYLSAKMQYPVSAQEEGASGTALVYFVVKSNGKIEDVRVINDVPSSLQDVALNVIRSMPDWIPGKKGNTAADIACTLPLKFISQSEYQRSLGKSLAIGGAFSEIPFGFYPGWGKDSKDQYFQKRW